MSGRAPKEAQPLSGAQLREAERGFIAMLRAKGFPGAWIDQNAIDLLAQANSEYAAWIKTREPEAKPVGWLITCAYRRAINLLDSQNRRPPTAAIEDAAEFADQRMRTPEEEVLDNERQRCLREAIGCLEPKDRRLISLVYFEGRSVREAGRHLGWRKSAADRHHQAALKRLRALVGEDPTLLSPASLGLAAWAGTGGRGPGVLQRLGEALRRLVPFIEPGGAAASSGAGRVLGACGAGLAAAVCGMVVSGVHPSPPSSEEPVQPQPAHHRAPARQAAPQDHPVVVASPEPKVAKKEVRRGSGEALDQNRSAPAAKPTAPELAARPQSAPTADPVVEEFGIEESATENQPAAEQGGTTAQSRASAPPPPPPPPHEASSAQVNEEFGL